MARSSRPPLAIPRLTGGTAELMTRQRSLRYGTLHRLRFSHGKLLAPDSARATAEPPQQNAIREAARRFRADRPDVWPHLLRAEVERDRREKLGENIQRMRRHS